MKKLLGLLIVLFCARMQAQNVEGQIIAAQFGEFRVPSQSGGGFQFPTATCQVSGGNKNFDAFAAGRAVKIVDSNPALTEIATPSSAFVTPCVLNMATTYVHVPPFYLTSGTGGLQEAITANQQGIAGPNSIILNAEWYALIQPRTAATVIASIQGNTNMPLVDVTTSPYTWYSWNGSAYTATVIGGGLPVATTSGQVPTSTGAGTTYTAQTPTGGALPSGSKGQTVYYAANGTTGTAVASPGIIVPPSGDATGATDGANIQAAITASGSVQLLAGTYHVGASNTTIAITASPCKVQGQGGSTVIMNHSTTSSVFTISYFTLWVEGVWVYPNITNQCELSGFQIQQASGVTPTGGYGFAIGSGIAQSGGTFSYTMNVHVHDVLMQGLWGGFSAITDHLYISVDNVKGSQFVGGGCINYNAEVGSGDDHWGPNLECSGLTYSGITIAQSDVQHFLGVKLNGSGIKFTGASTAKTVIFDDISVETGITQPCAFDFGTGTAPQNTQINNFEQYGFTTLFCHLGNVSGLAFSGANSLATNDYVAGLITNNGYTAVASTYQDYATFVGTVGTALSSYTTQAGKTFAQYSSDGVSPQAMPVLTGGGAEKISGGGNSYGDVYDTLTPASANYTVSETFTIAATTDQLGVFGRLNNAANTNYVFIYTGTGFLTLYSQVTGTAVQLLSDAFTWSAGATHTLALSMNGSTIHCLLDGADIAGSPVTNSAVSAAGQAGSRVYAGATGTNFYVQ